MSIILHRTPARSGLAALALLAAACTDQSPTGVAAAPPPGQEVRTAIACTVTVADARVRCGAPEGGAGSQTIILGGQGTYVRLESSSPQYDGGAGVFSVDVTVQNLLSQQMGTPDGTTVAGVQVFFTEQPAATEGHGEVTVANPDGSGEFTAAAQPYFHYPQMLEPRGSTTPRTWRFNVPATVVRFRFFVYVVTTLPAEQGVLRWLNEGGAAYQGFRQDLYGVWAGSPTDVFIGGANHIYHYDGNEWVAFRMTTWGNSVLIRDIAGSSRRRLYAVGSSGKMFRYDGNQWSFLETENFLGSLEGVWAKGDTAYAVGYGSDIDDEDLWRGEIMRSHDGGATWTRHRFPGPTGDRQLWDVSAASGTDVWAVGFDERSTLAPRTRALLLHSTDGGETWSQTVHADSGHRYYGAVWAEPGRTIVGGGHINIATGLWEALLMETRDGGATWSETWFAVPGQNRYVREVWGTPGGAVYAAGIDGSLFMNDGSGWTDVTPPGTASLYGLHGSRGTAFAVGLRGTVLRHRDGAWETVPTRSSAVGTLRAVWGSGPDDVFAVGHTPGATGVDQSLLLRRTGGQWTEALPPSDSTEFRDVFGLSASEVYVVGRRLTPGGSAGVIWRYDGGGWTATRTSFDGPERQLTAVWGSAAAGVYVLGRQSGPAGDQVVVLHSADHGETWQETAIGNAPEGQGHVLDVWGSDPANVYAVGYRLDPATPNAPRSLVLRYDGSAWSAATALDSVRLSGVWGAGRDSVFISGYRQRPNVPYEASGVVRATTNAGATWSRYLFPAPSIRERGLYGIWGRAGDDVYAVGDGSILHWDGVRWTEQGSHGWPRLHGVWGSSGGNLYAVGQRGVLLHGTR